MKKVTATVIYKENRLYNLTVNYKGNLIRLAYYDLEISPKPYQYRCFNELYQSVLNIMKQNNFYVASEKEFGALWYDIMWINIDNPTEIGKYALQ